MNRDMVVPLRTLKRGVSTTHYYFNKYGKMAVKNEKQIRQAAKYAGIAYMVYSYDVMGLVSLI
jgi:hypothetical protein